MDSEIEQFTLEELQEIKDQLEHHSVEPNKFKKAELSTIEICKEVGCFNGEAWLADDIQAGQSFCSRLGDGRALPYIAGMLQGGESSWQRDLICGLLLHAEQGICGC